MNKTGAQIIVNKLKEKGVKIVFEFPGGTICPILDELSRHRQIKIACFRHEQAAAHAADAYARLTRHPAVCLATSGPGASNLVTGIANAYMDSVPVVFITGQVAEWDLKKNRQVRQRGFQELDIVSVVKSVTKKAFLVSHVSELAKIIDQAFFIAGEGRPGPVLIDIPINIQYIASEKIKKSPKFKENKPPCSRKIIREIAHKMSLAQRPLVLAGGGLAISSSRGQLNTMLKKFRLPCAQTLMGLAEVESGYDYSLGLVGYAGSRPCSLAVGSADFILGLGLRFDNRAFPLANKEFSNKAYLVQVDCDRHELGHRVKVDRAILADVAYFIGMLAKELERKKFKTKSSWLGKIALLKKREENRRCLLGAKIKPHDVFCLISDLIKNRAAVITTDVGQHQLWAAQFLRFTRKHSWITSGGLGTMGFGLPAAIGASFAHSESLVLNITSDGSLQMNIQELATLKEKNIGVKIILLNNRCLGLVRQIQELAFGRRYVSTRVNQGINFPAIAAAYGIPAFSVSTSRQLKADLKKLLATSGPALLEVRLDEFENVFPVRVRGKVFYQSERA